METKKTALVIMAAGIGSRFGGGIKQLEPVDDFGHIIMDYSVHDAIEAGFNKIIFIIRHDIEEDFKNIIGNRIEEICTAAEVEVAYAFQAIDAIPEGFEVPAGRTKPWGTGQAVLAAKDVIDMPFAVINADDYYGRSAFQLLHNWLIEEHKPNEFSIAGFILKNTLSDNGAVTRGICKVNSEMMLTDIDETHDIIKTVGEDGKVGAETNGRSIDPDSYVSMNMWGLSPEFTDTLEKGFREFFEEKVPANPEKAEYLLPIYIGELLQKGEVSVEVLETKDAWFGVTYKEDKESVTDSFRELIAKGVYDSELTIQII